VEKLLAEKAIGYFEEGFNCSESMFKAYLDVYKKDQSMAGAASGFGGGIGGKGITCGAVSGAIMAIGLHFNRQSSSEKELYATIRSKSLAMVDQFAQENGTSYCKDLIPYDLTTMEGREKLHNDKETLAKCKGLLTVASRLLAKSLE